MKLTKEILAKSYIVDHVRGTISPVAAGQRFTHREYNGDYIVAKVEPNGYGGFKTTIDKDRSWDGFAASSDWDSENDMFKFLKFVDWAYGGPPTIDWTRYPHYCPRCGSKAYVGACGGGDVDCTNPDCPTRKR